MEHIAVIRSDFSDKFGIPRQSGLAPSLLARIVFEPAYRDPEALRGLEGFSHLWLIWEFSESLGHPWSPTVRPPRLGGNKRLGVFATRSPFRPNPIGLSCVEIVDVEPHTPEGPVITVRGADLTDGTPILDIKPYIVYADSRPDASSGYATEPPKPTLTVTGLDKLPPDVDPAAVEAILALDPRPAYKNKKDDTRVYHLKFDNYDIDFRATDDRLDITQARKTE